MGMAIALRKVSIHAPGFGKRLRSAGTQPSKRNGKARPKPSIANNSSAGIGGKSKAAPKAAAINGPEHGVATKAASKPVLNALACSPLRVTDTDGNSKLPAKFKVITVARINKATTTPGDCN